MIRSAICVLIGLMIGNFLFQALTAGDYGLAIEHTVRQIVAVVAIVWAERLRRHVEGGK